MAEEPSGLLRGVVEARILAGQSADEIADRTGIKTEAVGWFETLYYDVRDRLLFPDYILLSVIGLRPAATGEWATSLWAFKRAAYPHGVSDLEELIGCTDLQDPNKLPSVAACARRAQKILLAQCSLAAVTTMNTHDPILAGRLAELAAQEGSGESDGAVDKHVANAKAFLDGLNPRVGGRGDSGVNPFKRYDEAGIELDGIEQLLLVLGKTLPALSPEYFEFPEKRDMPPQGGQPG